MNEKEKTFNGKIAGKFNIFFRKIKGKYKLFALQKKNQKLYYNLVLQKF